VERELDYNEKGKGEKASQVEVACIRRRKRLGSVVERPMFWLQKHTTAQSTGDPSSGKAQPA